MTPVRSWLYAPGDRPELLAKAVRGRADAVVVDLEDAVSPSRKAEARASARELLLAGSPVPVWVRVNDPLGPWGEADLDALDGLPVTGVRLPKCEDPSVVRQVGYRLGRPMQLLLESAAGLERAGDLARAHPRVAGIGLGEADLAADLRTVGEETLSGCRFRVLLAARAAGLPAPVQSVWTDLRDADGLRASTERARDAGFFGRSVIHPSQVDVVNAVFTPTPRQVAAARELLDALDAAERDGRSALVDRNGRFVDPAVAEGARHTLALADRLGDAYDKEET
ncbi:CoA ester lyase [Actinomadura sp. DC4]|uniref:HpcH/HpaI aldolase/citrate lyase family protein n=1 Tax=Actinomadura sp. DC4 TaxID=3055069 RepID=UPI0025B0EC98|nr:CoA ester lyase [Actinomadura sp. DC4]MDN3356412.1 CoA ester lyase [Actinomadura sp. DC4]